MVKPACLVAVLLFAVGAASALPAALEPAPAPDDGQRGGAIDLTTIERKILSEPEYLAKKQQYCLLAFGPEAKFRAWLVHDVDILYVDRNGDGDFHTPGERIFGNHSGHFKVGTLIEPGGKIKHTSLWVSISRGGGSVSVRVGDRIAQTATFRVAEEPGRAPIVWLGGPIRSKLCDPQEVMTDKAGRYLGGGPKNILRRGQGAALSGFVGTPGLESFAFYTPRDVFPNGKLTVQLEFSKKGAKAVTSRGTLAPANFPDDRELDGTVPVPVDAPLGQAKMRVSFPENKDVELAPPLVRNVHILK